MPLVVTIGRRFARLATDVVSRVPALWPLFRPALTKQFDSLAPRWDTLRSEGHLAPYEAALAAIEPPPHRALDLGTGTGDGAVAIARRFPEADVTGADISAEMIEHARQKLPADLAGRVRFETADASRLPYEDGAFDLVALANMIPFYDELARVVAPGGRLLLAWSLGPATPIYVSPERARGALEPRGFTQFANFSAGSGTAILARKAPAS